MFANCVVWFEQWVWITSSSRELHPYWTVIDWTAKLHRSWYIMKASTLTHFHTSPTVTIPLSGRKTMPFSITLCNHSDVSHYTLQSLPQYTASLIRRSSWPIRYCMENRTGHTHPPNYCYPAANARRGLITIVIIFFNTKYFTIADTWLYMEMHGEICTYVTKSA